MSGDTDLLVIAASHMEEYCYQVNDCKECKIKSICETLDRESEPLEALHERIRRAAEEQPGRRKMKLDWKEEGRQGSIKRLKQPIEMTIHTHVGCGNALYLNCPSLRVSQLDLHTEDWDIAEGKAIEAVEGIITNLHVDAMKLIRQYEVAGKD